MPPVGFEPTISAGERPKTYALDRAATGNGYSKWVPLRKKKRLETTYRQLSRLIRDLGMSHHVTYGGGDGNCTNIALNCAYPRSVANQHPAKTDMLHTLSFFPAKKYLQIPTVAPGYKTQNFQIWEFCPLLGPTAPPFWNFGAPGLSSGSP